MGEAPADQFRDPELIDRLRGIAAGIFARYGIDFSAATRLGGWTNATWLAGDLVLRLSIQPGKDDLRREARLAALLPPEVGFPPVLEIAYPGRTGGWPRRAPGERSGSRGCDQ